MKILILLLLLLTTLTSAVNLKPIISVLSELNLNYSPTSQNYQSNYFSYIKNYSILNKEKSNDKYFSSLSQLLNDLNAELLKDDDLHSKLLLGDLNFRSPSPFLHNSSIAFETYKNLSISHGLPLAHQILGFYYDTGFNNVIDQNFGLSLLHYTFAALQSDSQSQMVLGYKHSIGDGVELSCGQGLEWYSQVADKSFDYYINGPPGGRTLPLTKPKLSDLSGGPYGSGASVASTGENANRPVIFAGKSRDAGESWHELLEYFTYAANQGELQYAIRLGNSYYHGSIYSPRFGAADGAGAIPQDFKKAKYWYTRATRLIWPHGLESDKSKQIQSPVSSHLISIAACNLGKMYIRGEGTSTNYKKGYKWLKRAKELKNSEAEYYLGLMFREGLGVDIDTETAHVYFTNSASMQFPEAYVALGNAYLDKGDIMNALQHYEWSVNLGNSFEGAYRLATLTKDDEKLCSVNLQRFKSLSERGDWLHGDKIFKEGMNRYEKAKELGFYSYGLRELEMSLLSFWRLAQQGYEVAQNNVAYLLDQDNQMLRIPKFDKDVNKETSKISLNYWLKSSNQNVIDSKLKVGDYYFKGLGVDDGKPNYELAAKFYLEATETQSSSLAFWNVGWMYENGLGLVKDYNLAKRYYDMALEVNDESFVPVVLSIVNLYIKSIWGLLKGNIDSNNNLLLLNNNVNENQQKLSKRQKEEINDLNDAKNDVNNIDWRSYSNINHELDYDINVEDLLNGNFNDHDDHSTLHGSQADDRNNNDLYENSLILALVLTLILIIYVRRTLVNRARQRTIERLTDEITSRAHNLAGHNNNTQQDNNSNNDNNDQNNTNDNERNNNELRRRIINNELSI